MYVPEFLVEGSVSTAAAAGLGEEASMVCGKGWLCHGFIGKGCDPTLNGVSASQPASAIGAGAPPEYSREKEVR